MDRGSREYLIRLGVKDHRGEFDRRRDKRESSGYTIPEVTQI